MLNLARLGNNGLLTKAIYKCGIVIYIYIYIYIYAYMYILILLVSFHALTAIFNKSLFLFIYFYYLFITFFRVDKIK